MNTVKRVEELACLRGLTIYQVSQMSSISYSTISTAKRRGSQLTVDTIERICQALGIAMSDFFAENRDKE